MPVIPVMEKPGGIPIVTGCMVPAGKRRAR